MNAKAHQATLEALFDTVHEYFMVPLPPHVRVMYARDMAAYSTEEVAWSIDTFRVAPPPLGHKKTAPRPHELIALLQQQLADRHAADNLASVIWASIALFGRTQPQRAMERIGPEGQEAVRLLGGWELLCKTARQQDVNLWNAQLRDKALAVRAQAKQTAQTKSLAAVTRNAHALAQAKTQQQHQLPEAQPQRTAGMGNLADIMAEISRREAVCVP